MGLFVNVCGYLIIPEKNDFIRKFRLWIFPILSVYLHENTHRTMYHVMTSIFVFSWRFRQMFFQGFVIPYMDILCFGNYRPAFLQFKHLCE